MEKEKVSLEDAKEHGLTETEFVEIQKILGRMPNSTELGIFSAMWSEHCSYKNSILKLKTLPTKSDKLLAQAGEENAGAMDIGDGLAVVFKIESHNHPTAVEPYQGAATGVGGIMRDIFTMGARPITSLNSLRFGDPKEPRNKYLLTRAVKGIGDYGNSLGIAVGGGELFIHPTFTKNPLVNAMTVGIARHDQMASASTKGKVGYKVYIVGATTGRDGIHGASFASKDLTKESEEKRSAVQVGDPFMEKLLMEASLEAIQKNLLVGIQDMGAAGISCATSEMSAKGKTGMDVDLDKVPLRESDMNAYEIMLSESQERMLVIPETGKEEELVSIFHKWGLNAVEIGTVTGDGILRIRKDGKLKAEIPADSLVLGGGAPRYVREEKRPTYLDEVTKFDPTKINDLSKDTVSQTLNTLLSSLNISSRRPLYEQYDTEVGLVKVVEPGEDGGLVRIPGTKKGIAVATDCNSRYTYLNPYEGAQFAVCESARNVAATGAEPYGVTNNLNFGNPYIPENYYIFSECVRGLGDACRFLGLPVTGGNVSFYNESPEGPVFPTPTIGMVGVIDDVAKGLHTYPRTEKEVLYALVGEFQPTISASEYLYRFHGLDTGKIPTVSLAKEKATIDTLISCRKEGLLTSAKDLSLGGLLVALAKIVISGNKGLEVNLEELQKRFKRLDELCFGETGASFVISFLAADEEKVKAKYTQAGLGFTTLGKSNSKSSLSVKGNGFQWEWTTKSLEAEFESGLKAYFE
ncbi:phosphoribosylformylglycinamidine synthase subunit PurL [Leptospira bandrabouensis]|uniref:phosphoribosylformylglycinamidine synthase subunit PurL n=1 Tax=Leptospira bandrabouensis TaxID=2484903 RepID=UPI00223DC2EF|nr:phosphoribosylformylglycinamidine synthase subunit PurL [Leptospira bandrabouensis]MCW7459237.1 phosphoribosylformylglycinamidine synthase subunit PurL [Leptospira bandrabouensis]MCW7478330.1 phosphoribosylformylglycinamidine synthase subunit PurL [Leptospira bandrabouensis]MCW7485548.1 phosphoribosylformylglycinamidine synthase subunit PurL [Leptospira bandrabouensis]